MIPLLTVHSISKAYGSQTLFREISFTINPGDCIGLIGPNGSGKSSLIKMLAGLEEPDSGHISKKQKLKIGFSSQSPQFPTDRLEDFLMHQIPETEKHTALTRARELLGKAEFPDFSLSAQALSGGWKKRLDIIRALMNEPDLLLLDEPTNHLDLEGILWLENFLKKIKIPFLVISHDRFFLENTTNKIIEINRSYPNGLLECEGNLGRFLEQKEEFLHALENKQRELAFKVREEVDWLRTSPKARTTKSQARIQQAYKLIDQLADVKARRKVQKVEMEFSDSERQTQKLLVAKNLSKSMGGKELFKNINVELTPGTRLGIVGKNGTGKTTLLKILAGKETFNAGSLKYADNLKMVYFDQHREQIPLDLTLKEAFSPHSDHVTYRGQQIHVNSWAKRFLFSPDRMNLPVKYLSGGERARIIIAKLILQPADILFLDEPTNDLDIQTLEVLEESLQSFSGAIVLISHDRYLMENLTTGVLGLGEEGEQAYYASYHQWQENQLTKKKKEKENATRPTPAPQKSLSYKEKKELENMEQLILSAETKLEELQKKIDSEGYSQSLYNEIADTQDIIHNHYLRWQDLLNRRS